MQEPAAAPAGAARQWLLDAARTLTPPRLRRRYHQQPAFRRRVRRALVGSVVAFLGFGILFGDGGLAVILVRRVQVWQLERQVAGLERRAAWLQHEVELRESDAAKLERLARERYGMARPDETVYQIVEITPSEARRIEREQRRLREADEEEAVTEREPQRRPAGHAKPPARRRPTARPERRAHH